MPNSTQHWHTLSPHETARRLDVDPTQGLGVTDAARRLAHHGPNRPTERPPRSPWLRFLDQLVQPLVAVLVAAGLVTAFLGEWVDASVILGVVLVNAAVGFIQEGRAESALAALARAVATEVTVLREGERRRLDAAELVPGDVVWLAAGDKVPADLRLLHGKELRLVEAALTGESLPADKHPALVLAADTPLADRRNMAYAGTHVAAGQGHGLVIATGDATETGRIAGLIASAADLSTPLTRKMGEFARWLLVVILACAALTFLVGVLRGESAYAMFMAAVALAIGAIPEGLPAAITITLAIGVARMAKRRAIIRKLPAVETLGSTTVICSDKTGTLTENAMTVRAVWAGGRRHGVGGQGYGVEGALEPSAAAGGGRGPARDPAGGRALQRRQPAPRRPPLAHHRRPHRGRPAGGRPQGGTGRDHPARGVPAPGRAALRRRPPDHGHPARDRGRPGGLRQGRVGTPAAGLRRHARRRWPRGARGRGRH
jgi:cation-transporting ATPase F